MRVFLRHVRRRQRSVHGPTSYRSAAYHPLRPWQSAQARAHNERSHGQ